MIWYFEWKYMYDEYADCDECGEYGEHEFYVICMIYHQLLTLLLINSSKNVSKVIICMLSMDGMQKSMHL